MSFLRDILPAYNGYRNEQEQGDFPIEPEEAFNHITTTAITRTVRDTITEKKKKRTFPKTDDRGVTYGPYFIPHPPKSIHDRGKHNYHDTGSSLEEYKRHIQRISRSNRRQTSHRNHVPIVQQKKQDNDAKNKELIQTSTHDHTWETINQHDQSLTSDNEQKLNHDECIYSQVNVDTIVKPDTIVYAPSTPDHRKDKRISTLKNSDEGVIRTSIDDPIESEDDQSDLFLDYIPPSQPVFSDSHHCNPEKQQQQFVKQNSRTKEDDTDDLDPLNTPTEKQQQRDDNFHSPELSPETFESIGEKLHQEKLSSYPVCPVQTIDALTNEFQLGQDTQDILDKIAEKDRFTMQPLPIIITSKSGVSPVHATEKPLFVGDNPEYHTRVKMNTTKKQKKTKHLEKTITLRSTTQFVHQVKQSSKVHSPRFLSLSVSDASSDDEYKEEQQLSIVYPESKIVKAPKKIVKYQTTANTTSVSLNRRDHSTVAQESKIHSKTNAKNRNDDGIVSSCRNLMGIVRSEIQFVEKMNLDTCISSDNNTTKERDGLFDFELGKLQQLIDTYGMTCKRRRELSRTIELEQQKASHRVRMKAEQLQTLMRCSKPECESTNLTCRIDLLACGHAYCSDCYLSMLLSMERSINNNKKVATNVKSKSDSTIFSSWAEIRTCESCKTLSDVESLI